MTVHPSTESELRKLWLAGIVVVCVSAAFIMLWDEPLAWYFETQMPAAVHTTMGIVTEAANGAIWYGLAVLGLAWSSYKVRKATNSDVVIQYQRYVRAWVFMASSMLTAAALLNFFKFAIGRYRPRYLFNEGLAGFEPFGIALKMASFPSGHTQSICSAMAALCFLTPRFAPAYIAIALAVSMSRFVTAVHFVSDVIVGGFLSILVAVMIRRWFERNGQMVRLNPN